MYDYIFKVDILELDSDGEVIGSVISGTRCVRGDIDYEQFVADMFDFAADGYLVKVVRI